MRSKDERKAKKMNGDEEKRFMEKVHNVMTKCGYRKDMDGIGVCSLNIAPCEKVLYKGECEAVAKWFKEGEEGCNS